jgi:acetoin utilization deacetylase AcuC-like enzyme
LKIYVTDQFSLPVPAGHRFPVGKYALLRHRVADSELGKNSTLLTPEPASEAQLSLAHQPDYVRRVLQGELTEKEIRRIGFPWSPQLVERSRRSVGGTIAACRAALQEGVAVNLAGGTHHAYADHGEGYCVFNDAAVAARCMQSEGCAQRIVILDCDVHQGNGTAAIFAEDPSVFTLSIHAAKNFPFHKEPSDVDIDLPDGAGDQEYLEILRWAVWQSLMLSQADFAIYLAGADPFAGDELGRLALSKAGLAERDKIVFDLCRQIGMPVAVTMSGGYGGDITDTVDIHYQTVQLAYELWLRSPQQLRD